MRLKLGRQILAYDVSGRDTTRPPLLLLHAFPLDRRMWQPLIQQLEHNVQMATLDFPGLGESVGEASIDAAADAAAGLLDHLAMPRAVVAGLSMGGYVALAFARRHPQRLAALLLADTRAGGDSAEGRLGRDRSITAVVESGVSPFARELLPKLVAPGNPAALAFALALAEIQPAGGVASALAALRDRPDATAGLAAIAVPTTVVVGALDQLTPPAEAARLAAAIPGATLVEIPGAGHLSAIEAPLPFARAVDALYRRLAP